MTAPVGGWGLRPAANNLERAGQLLRLADYVIVAKADGSDEAEAELVSHVIRSAAEQAAVRGTDFALGWVDGWWYATGNKSTSDGSSNNETWRQIRLVLGEPVR
jgi:hypothetical protein